MTPVMYHYVRPGAGALSTYPDLALDDFERQLDHFSETRGLVGREAFERWVGGGTAAAGFLLTFDDGLRDHVDFVLPVLRRRGLFGLFYVPSAPMTDGVVLDVHKLHLVLGRLSGAAALDRLEARYPRLLEEATEADVGHYAAQVSDLQTKRVKYLLNWMLEPDERHEVVDDLVAFAFDGWAPGVDGFRVTEFRAGAPRIPYLRNYFKNERFYRRFGRYLECLVSETAADVVHAQHLLTTPPAVVAARRRNVPVVCTVRDYWPVCYWTDLIHDRGSDRPCPTCSVQMMTRCVRPRAGRLWPLALPFIPYMRANLALKRAAIAQADAVIAVSAALARDLRGRAPELERTRVEVIPNPVDVDGIRSASDAGEPPLDGPYAIYAGKLAFNKGSTKLIPVLERAGLTWPLIVVGDGPERGRIEAAARRAGHDVRFTGWLPRPDVLRWLRHATVLIFPSQWGEPLSRVLLEAATLGVPTAAMETGGTPEIVVNEETGLLSATVDDLAADVARLCRDAGLRERLGAAARVRVESLFGTQTVVQRVEALYRDLVRSAQDPPGPVQERGP